MGVGLNRVDLAMAISVQDEGVADALAQIIEQVEAVKRAFQEIADMPDPFAELVDQAEQAASSVAEQAQRMRQAIEDGLAPLRGAAGELRVAVDSSQAVRALDEVRAAGVEDLSAVAGEAARVSAALGSAMSAGADEADALGRALEGAGSEAARALAADIQAATAEAERSLQRLAAASGEDATRIAEELQEALDRASTAGVALWEELSQGGVQAAHEILSALDALGQQETALFTRMAQAAQASYAETTRDAAQAAQVSERDWRQAAEGVQQALRALQEAAAQAFAELDQAAARAGHDAEVSMRASADASEESIASALRSADDAWAEYARIVAEDTRQTEEGVAQLAAAIDERFQAAMRAVDEAVSQSVAQAREAIEQAFAEAGRSAEESVQAAADSMVLSFERVAQAAEQAAAAERAALAEGAEGRAPTVVSAVSLGSEYVPPPLPSKISTQAPGLNQQALVNALYQSGQLDEAVRQAVEDAAQTMAQDVESAVGAVAREAAAATSASAESGFRLPNLLGAGMTAWMAAQGVQMLQQSSMGMVALNNLLQQSPGASTNDMARLIAALGAFGLNPQAAVAELTGLQAQLMQRFTITGESGYAKDVLLAFQQAGYAGLLAGNLSPENVLSQLKNLGLGPQIETLSYLYQDLIRHHATSAQVATLFQGLGLDQTMQAFVENYAQIAPQLRGFNLGLDRQQVAQQAQQALNMGVAMGELNMELAKLASDVVPAFSQALQVVSPVLDQVGGLLRALTPALEPVLQALAPGFKALAEALEALTPVVKLAATAVGEVFSAVETVFGGYASLVGRAIASVPFLGGVGRAVEQFGAEELFSGIMQARFPGLLGAPAGQALQVPNPVNQHYTIQITMPANAGATARQWAEQAATEIVRQLKLASNLELSF